MQYMGSKNRIAKQILPIILKNRKPGQYYVEPFVGGANIIDKVDGNRIGADSHSYLIAMWKALQAGWQPPTVVTKEEYYRVKNNQTTELLELVGFVGFLCSFGVKWWGGYASNKDGRNYANQGVKSLLKQIRNIQGVKFVNSSYQELEIPSNSIIYCDPPYQNTVDYKDKFNHEEFWEWARKMSKAGHEVFISEYQAPEDFECLKEIVISTTLNRNTKQKRVEKLFRFKQ